MNPSGICHRMKSEYAFAPREGELVLRLRTAKGDIQRTVLFFGDRAYPKNPIRLEPVEMDFIGSTLYHDWWEVRLYESLPRICYYFWLQSGQESLYYFGDELRETPLVHRSEFYQFPYINRDDLFKVPQWFEKSVMYQIFPDSFASGYRQAPSGPREREFESRTRDWSPVISEKEEVGSKGDSLAQVSPLPALPEVTPEKVLCKSRLGGTIEGIRKNLDYLLELGITCLYLNPICAAHHWHKYDVIDYLSVDPVFGSEDDLRALINDCHSRNIRVLIDGVFNHAGGHFFAFRDLIENGEKSRYKDWFYEVDYPLQATFPPSYAAFGYEAHMPKLNTGNPEVRDYFCRVGQYWIQEFGIDGWRLDVANEVDHEFWRAFRKAVEWVNPEAVLIGEIWEDSHAWLDGSQYHSSMNYEFARVCREFFAEERITPQAFMEKSLRLLVRYPEPVSTVQMNLLDSHDVPRFMVWCDGQPERMSAAIFFQFTFPGVPSVYMGDELGYTGLEESEYRRAIEWNQPAPVPGFAELYRRLIHLRKDDEILQSGVFRPWSGDYPHRVVGFWRIAETRGVAGIGSEPTPGQGPESVLGSVTEGLFPNLGGNHPKKTDEPFRDHSALAIRVTSNKGSSRSRLVVINTGHRTYYLIPPEELEGKILLDLYSNNRYNPDQKIPIRPGHGVILCPVE